LGEKSLVTVVQLLALFIGQVAAAACDFEMGLAFRGLAFGVVEFADERCRVSTLAPRLRNIGGD